MNITTKVTVEILRGVTLKSTIFWDMMPWSLCRILPTLWKTYSLYLQDWRAIQASCKHGKSLLAGWLTYSLILKTEAVRYSETPIKFYQTTCRCSPEYSSSLKSLGMTSEKSNWHMIALLRPGSELLYEEAENLVSIYSFIIKLPRNCFC
jgi:hypothetical protein